MPITSIKLVLTTRDNKTIIRRFKNPTPASTHTTLATLATPTSNNNNNSNNDNNTNSVNDQKDNTDTAEHVITFAELLKKVGSLFSLECPTKIITVSYKDDEGDVVRVSSDDELIEAYAVADSLELTTLKLYIDFKEDTHTHTQNDSKQQPLHTHTHTHTTSDEMRKYQDVVKAFKYATSITPLTHVTRTPFTVSQRKELRQIAPFILKAFNVHNPYTLDEVCTTIMKYCATGKLSLLAHPLYTLFCNFTSKLPKGMLVRSAFQFFMPNRTQIATIAKIIGSVMNAQRNTNNNTLSNLLTTILGGNNNNSNILANLGNLLSGGQQSTQHLGRLFSVCMCRCVCVCVVSRELRMYVYIYICVCRKLGEGCGKSSR